MKDVIGYEGLYKIDKDGNVWSMKKEKFISQSENNDGYMSVNLYKNGTQKTMLVHRLVALSYIENPNNLKEVNHIDSNRKNNNYENLVWCTHSENIQHSYDYGNAKQKKGIENNRHMKIAMIDPNTNKTISIFYGQSEASRETGVPQGNISRAIKRGIKSGGFKWIVID